MSSSSTCALTGGHPQHACPGVWGRYVISLSSLWMGYDSIPEFVAAICEPIGLVSHRFSHGL